MRKVKTIFLLLILFITILNFGCKNTAFDLSDYENIHVEEFIYYSEALGKDRKYLVCVPVNYDLTDINLNQSQNILWFFHGGNVDHWGYPEVFEVFNSFVREGKIDNTVIIFPDLSLGDVVEDPNLNSLSANSELLGDFENMLFDDLRKELLNRFNFQVYTGKNAAMGHSAGGFTTLLAATKYPETFKYVVALSPLATIQENSWWINEVKKELKGKSEFNIKNGSWTKHFITLCQLFSPDPGNGKYNCDYLIDIDGNINQEVLNRWLKSDPYNIFLSNFAVDSSIYQEIKIYVECGLQDEVGLLENTTFYYDKMKEIFENIEFKKFEGKHVDKITERIYNIFPQVIEFFKN